MTLRAFSALVPLLYLLACSVFVGVIAYPAFLALQGAVSFRTLMFRGALVVMLAGVVVLSKRLGLGWSQLGLASGLRSFCKQLAQGWAWGVAILAIHVALLLLADVRVISDIKIHDYAAYPRWIGKSLAMGLGVGLNEELLFRGMLLGYLLPRMTAAWAILTSAFYFAGIHFLNTSMDPGATQLGWMSGMTLVGDAFASLGERFHLDTFLALFTAGAFLATVRVYVPFGLALCMGIHAGWVFVIKVARYVTLQPPKSEWAGMVGNLDGVIGYLSAFWISLLILGLMGWFRWRERAREKAGKP